MAEQNQTQEHVVELGQEEVHHGYDHLYQDPTFWVAMAIITFFLLLIWKKIPAMIGKMLDSRVNEISAQLDNAQTLREEASALLAKYQRDQRDAEKVAAEMIAHAEEEVKLLAGDAKVQIATMVERRTKLAEQKIAQSEANALKEIQQLSVEVATAAARELIAGNMKKADHDALITADTDKLDSQLH
ncbi:MAG: F0F1 ATP synthase subunit B [Alphaproteobacteria bacterium]|nr:F0F1 ATP synthase subunit B [Alphaproteobacteria bacterium]